MHKVLIVDDDKLIRQDIQALVKWEEHGFVLAGEAGNGAEALDLIKSIKPDIVVTDIYMPVMDGIQLIKSAKSMVPGAKFLVISNYDDFKYVKEAMKLGATDYILKYEIEKDNFVSLLEGCRQQIMDDEKRCRDTSYLMEMSEQGKAHLQGQFWRSLLEGQLDEESTAREAARLEVSLREGSFILMLADLYPLEMDRVRYASPETERNEINAAPIIRECVKDAACSCVIPVTENRWAVVLHPMEKSFAYLRNAGLMAANNIKAKIAQTDGWAAVISLGDICTSACELASTYSRLRKMAENSFYTGLDAIIDSMSFRNFCCEMEEPVFDHYRKQILQEMYSNKPEKAEKCIRELMAHIRSKRYLPQLVYSHMADLILQVHKTMKRKAVDDGTVPHDIMMSYHEFSRFATLYNVERYLCSLLKHAANSGTETSFKREEIRKAVEMIHKSYMNELSLNDIAEHAGLSRTYFCRVFKEETGDNFIDYVNRVRIDKAKFFIENSSAKAVEIAYKVGIRDYRYFCRIFKQLTGQRPNEYKKGKLHELA